MVAKRTSEMNLPHNDYASGYRVGWEAVNGDTGPAPMLMPLPPAIPVLGFSPFILGVRDGVAAALEVDDLEEARGSSRTSH